MLFPREDLLGLSFLYTLTRGLDFSANCRLGLTDGLMA